MARRLLEIEQRNEIRGSAQLPLLSIPKELRRMKQQEVSKEFEQFNAARSKAVWQDVLKRHRNAEGNPNWKPNSLEGMGNKRRSQNSLGEILPRTPKRVSEFRREGQLVSVESITSALRTGD
jgi:hypothetical protein